MATPAGPVHTLFSAEHLSTLVRDVLPPATDHKFTVVGTIDLTGAQAVARFTSVGGTWQLEGAYRHTWAGDNQATAKVLFTL